MKRLWGARLLALLLTLVAALAAALAAPLAHAQTAGALDEPRYRAALEELLASPQGRVLLEAYLALRRDPLAEVASEELLLGALLGMLTAVDDPYLRLLSPAELEAEARLLRVDPAIATLSFEEVGYLRIPTFHSERVGPAVRRAVERLQGAGAQGVILDLRGNPGGLIRAGLEVLDLFLSDVVLGFRSKRSESTPMGFANPGSLRLPVVVLIDGGTASTAELVAGVLQSYGRALLVGGASAGKGVGQTRVPLSDGSALELVSFRWSLPDGTSVDEGGLVPDLAIDPSAALGERPPVWGEPELDPVLSVAVRLLWQQLRREGGATTPER